MLNINLCMLYILPLTETLEDLEYADDIALLAHRHQDIQDKTEDLLTYNPSLSITTQWRGSRNSSI